MIRKTTKDNISIDLACISINPYNGPNSASNKRCSEHDLQEDGFVYNNICTLEDGEYKYKGDVIKESDSIDKIHGHTENDKYYYANYVRNRGGVRTESAVNFGSAKTIDGRVTKDFVYNEGNSSTLGNEKYDEISKNESGSFKNAGMFDERMSKFEESKVLSIRQLNK